MRGSSQSGFSITELMIAVAIGLIVLASLTSFFVSTSTNRREIERNSRQIENGRFAIDSLRQEIRLAGFYADLPQAGAAWQTPDPCLTAGGSLGVLFASPAQLPVPIFGYADDTAAPGCVVDRVAGTEVLVIRRFNTEATMPGVAVAGLPYFQMSRCASDSITTPWVYADGSSPGSFSLRDRNCGGPAEIYRLRVSIFYVRSYSILGSDTTPTLVRLDLGIPPEGGAVQVYAIPLVEGIRDLRFEYGIDANENGAPEAYKRCIAADVCMPADWGHVTAVRMHVLAENLEATVGYKDVKEYYLGAAGMVGPFGDGFKRHVYTSLAAATNRSGLWERP